MDVLELLRQNERKELLRLITAGSVDDGKSTLIGRLLYEAKGIYEDQLASVKKVSTKRGSAQGEVDYSLFTDGLKAEREQNITIDVAYRYFSTPRRKFIIADTPGHEQYTRNMVTGASTASLMVILIDASQGMLDQSRRHAFIASLLGIQHIVVAINKMDLVGYSREVFDRLRKEFSEFAAKLQPHDVTFIPVSALHGDNIVTRSAKTPWYEGSTLLNHLETVHLASDRNLIDLRLPVQYVSRPSADFRGYMGTVASGVIRKGDEIVVLPSGARSTVRAVLGPDGEIPEAFPPMACCVVLADEIDISRGNMLIHPHNRPSVGDTFEALVVWMASEPLRPGRAYQIKQTTRSLQGEAASIRYRIDVNTLHRQETSSLEMNEVGRVVMKLSQPIAYDPYSLNRATGSFLLIDRVTNNTVGAGMILPRDPKEPPAAAGPSAPAAPAKAPPETATLVSPADRAKRIGHKPATICLHGGSAAARIALAYALEKRLFDLGCLCHVLPETSPQTARILNDAGLIAIVAWDEPQTPDALRQAIGADSLLDVQLDDPARPPQTVEEIVALLTKKGFLA